MENLECVRVYFCFTEYDSRQIPIQKELEELPKEKHRKILANILYELKKMFPFIDFDYFFEVHIFYDNSDYYSINFLDSKKEEVLSIGKIIIDNNFNIIQFGTNFGMFCL